MNEFIDYLNTFHRCNNNNKNATAESNALSEFGKDILVPPVDLVNKIINKLNSEQPKVLLTGFAGDGKTTLAQLVVAELTGNRTLSDPIQVFQNTSLSRPLVVIKDLSENGREDERHTIRGYLADANIALLLVSNTGTVLDFLKESATELGFSENEGETEILKGIGADSETGDGEIALGVHRISVVNLVRHDNLPMAKAIFLKIINHKSWDELTEDNLEYQDICKNIQALKNPVVFERIFLIYKRLYEYGERLTIRNLLEHITFTITGGYSSASTGKYFFDNFFGDSEIENAKNIVAIKLIAQQKFGFHISSHWKRDVWTNENSTRDLKIPELFREVFKESRDIGLSNKSESGSRARLRVYRMIYFLSPLTQSTDGRDAYLSGFLNSPGLIIWNGLQNSTEISRALESKLINRVRHVVKEYFAGVKLPENEEEGTDDIYITMSRNSQDIRQTAQAVIASFKWTWKETVWFNLEKDVRGNNQLVLIKVRKNSSANFNRTHPTDTNVIRMLLPVPFLDYLLKRHAGHIDPIEFQNFQKRLDAFKISILQDERKGAGKLEDNSILLVRMNSKRSLKDIKFSLIEDESSQRLEVFS